MAAVSHLCTRAVLLERGRLVAEGPTDEVVRAYLASASGTATIPLADREDRRGSGELRLESVSLLDPEGGELSALRAGDDALLELAYGSAGTAPLRNVRVALALDTVFGQRVTVLDNELAGYSLDRLPPSGRIRCFLPKCPLVPGRYGLSVYVTVNGVLADWIVGAGTIDVAAGDFFATGRTLGAQDGVVALRQSWSPDA
jgi:lipopolysaccharide transport system ATP-binding protein